jgi:flagellar basal body-associated protein FliL
MTQQPLGRNGRGRLVAIIVMIVIIVIAVIVYTQLIVPGSTPPISTGQPIAPTLSLGG